MPGSFGSDHRTRQYAICWTQVLRDSGTTLQAFDLNGLAAGTLPAAAG